ncbi:MAG TPA: hypothetical protein VMQ81_09490 [Acidimicrobiia bacterium]|nr:hypothetical protein [Acidimicrobiia bacterium]
MVVGSIVALVGEGLVEGLDFEILAAFFRAIPDILGFLVFDAFTSPRAT